MKKLLFIATLTTLLFSSCSSDDNPCECIELPQSVYNMLGLTESNLMIEECAVDSIRESRDNSQSVILIESIKKCSNIQ